MHVAKKILRRLLCRPPATHECRRMASFAAAAKAAGPGYLDPAILSSTGAGSDGAPSLTGLPDFFGPFFTMLASALKDKPGQPITVLDFGGAMGDYAGYARAMFGDRFDWHVVETDLYVQAGRRCGNRVSFHTSIDDLPATLDAAMFSGSLQYLQDWKAVLAHPRVLAAPMVYIARTPLGPDYIAYLQTVRYPHAVVHYPGAVLPEAELHAALSATHRLCASFSLQDHFDELGDFPMPAMIWRRNQ